MNLVTHQKTYTDLPFCHRECLRYAGYRGEPDPQAAALLREGIEAVSSQLQYKVCYQLVPVSLESSICRLGALTLSSAGLAHVLAGCEKAVVFAATIGVAIDRITARYSHISPARALVLQGIGAAQIETLCDTFCADMERETGLFGVPRFSPGYGDLAIETQRDFFALLGCEKRIGLTLNDSLLMSPTKSVTAILGLTKTGTTSAGHKCAVCPHTDCAYRERT